MENRIDSRRTSRPRPLLTGLACGLWTLVMGIATNVENMFPSANVGWLSSVASGITVGVGVWLLFTVIRQREELRQVRRSG